MTYKDRVVVITGASSGIGWEFARWYARQGAKIGVLARRAEPLTQLCALIHQEGGIAEFRTADVADRAGTLHAITDLTATLGPCDLLIANAGIGSTNTASHLNVEGAEHVVRTNFLGALYAIEAVYDSMVQRRAGQIVGISSVAAFKGLPTAAAYCASKAALSTYLESLRVTLRPYGVSVTTIHPGFIRTPMTANNDAMMFPLEVGPAVERMARAIRQRRKVYAFPKRLVWLVRAMRWLPDWAVAKLVPDDPRR